MDSVNPANFMLGQSTNLINGYKASSVFLDEAPFTPSIQPALGQIFLSALLQIKLRPCSFEDKPSEGGGVPIWPAGALMLAGLTKDERTRALTNLSKEIGLDLSTPE